MQAGNWRSSLGGAPCLGEDKVPHAGHLAAACSLECGSWLTEACGCRPLSLMTPASIPAFPAMAFRTRPQLLPISLCSVSPSPPTFHSLLLPTETGPRACPPTCLCILPDPAQVTVMPPETPLPTGMRGVIRCPVRANPPLLFVTWTKDGQALQLDKVQAWDRGRSVLARCYSGQRASCIG